MTDAAAPPAATLYVGHVMHMRLRPRRHRFRYPVWTLLLDLDRMGEVARHSRLLRIDRPGLVSVRSADHGPRDGSPLRPWVEAECTRAGLPRPHRVLMLAMPRVLGYAFNPLTAYFGLDRHGRLESVVYEVKNTFGDQIAYALPAGSEDAGGFHDQTQRKAMFVSPFIDMDQTYRFRTRLPGDRLALLIREAGTEGETLIASQTGGAVPFSDAALLRLLATRPFVTFRVIAGIHWQALRLFLKGIRFLGHPGEGKVFVKDREPA